ncbi:Adaptor for signal transduction [Tulasnella sp. 403]|nr:Adaptor for signal transduction [Tulasnella sp. 403]
MATESIVLQWDEDAVGEWLASIGFGHYRENILEQGISGDVLIHLDFDSLRDIGIVSAGHRLEILKAIYRLKVENGIPIEPEHYVPLSETNEEVFAENTPLGRLMQMISMQNERIRTLETELQRLQNGVISLEEYVLSRPNGSGAALQKQPSFKWASYGKAVKSPTRAVADENNTLNLQPQDSPRVSPQALEHDLTNHASSSMKPAGKSADQMEISLPSRTPSLPPYATEPPPLDRSQPSARNQSNGASDSRGEGRSRNEDRSDNVFQSFKVSLEDPCSKVLPAALKKYRITDDWRLYALFICYGTTGNLDEKPLLLFKKLKDAGKNPVFMLRHIKDIRGPITVAQGKKSRNDGSVDMTGQAARKPEKTAGTPHARDARLHQSPALLQASGSKKGNGLFDSSPDDMDRSRSGADDNNMNSDLRPTGNGPGHTEAIILWTGISYAIAIYPYGADFDDEFDVTVGATFVVLRRSKGWWQVQRDPSGTGVVDERQRKAWVPAGCLLETSVPPTTAIAEAAIVASAQPSSPSAYDVRSLQSPVSSLPMSDAPILPSSIVSTSYPGIALMDWLPQGDHELDLVKDDILRVFKRYNHWSYVVKEGGRRGWVPSWLIGKIGSHNPTNQSNSAIAPPSYDGNGEETGSGSRNLGVELSQHNGFPAVSR